MTRVVIVPHTVVRRNINAVAPVDAGSNPEPTVIVRMGEGESSYLRNLALLVERALMAYSSMMFVVPDAG